MQIKIVLKEVIEALFLGTFLSIATVGAFAFVEVVRPLIYALR